MTSVNYLVVAGGAGGGSTHYTANPTSGGGGGGAGGFLAGSGLSVTAGTTYAITVGAGGVGVDASVTNGTNGTNSLFGTLVNGSTGAVGGGGVHGRLHRLFQSLRAGCLLNRCGKVSKFLRVRSKRQKWRSRFSGTKHLTKKPSKNSVGF